MSCVYNADSSRYKLTKTMLNLKPFFSGFKPAEEPRVLLSALRVLHEDLGKEALKLRKEQQVVEGELKEHQQQQEPVASTAVAAAANGERLSHRLLAKAAAAVGGGGGGIGNGLRAHSIASSSSSCNGDSPRHSRTATTSSSIGKRGRGLAGSGLGEPAGLSGSRLRQSRGGGAQGGNSGRGSKGREGGEEGGGGAEGGRGAGEGVVVNGDLWVLLKASWHESMQRLGSAYEDLETKWVLGVGVGWGEGGFKG